MLRLKLLGGGTILIRANAISAISCDLDGATRVFVEAHCHMVAHTIEQVRTAVTKVRPTETDDSLFGRVFG